MTILEALEKWLATIAPGQDAKHNLEALNQASVALGGPGGFKSVGPAWDDVLSRYQGGGGGDYTPYDGEYEVTPSTEDQTLATKDKGLDDNVTVKAVTAAIDENIKAENIKHGVTVLGVEGAYEGDPYGGAYEITPSTSPQTLQTAGKLMEQNLEIEGISPVDSKQNVFAAYTADPNTSALTPVGESEDGGLSVMSDDSTILLVDVEGSECPAGTFIEAGGVTGLMIFADKHAAAPYWHSGSHDLPVSGADMEKATESMDQAGGFQFQIQSSFLKPENIKQGVSIFGVAGSYAPGNEVKPIALAKIGGVDNASHAAFFNGRHYLFGVDSAFYSTDGVTFQRDAAYDTAYGATTTSTTERYNKAIHGAFVFGSTLVAVVGFTTAEDAPYNHTLQFIYTLDGTTWTAGEVIVNQAVAAGDVEDVATGVSASHLIVYHRHNTEAKCYYFVSADVSPLEYTFAQMTAGITASSGSEYAEEGTVKICRWDSAGDALLMWQNDSGAWYFGKVSIEATDLSSAPVPTKAFTPEQVTCLQYVEVSNAVGVGLSTGAWIALTALEEESQPGGVTPIFTGSSVLALAFGGEGYGIAGGVGGAMAFCSAGGAWKTFTPINGGSNLVSTAYGNNVFVMAGEGEEASISVQV